MVRVHALLQGTPQLTCGLAVASLHILIPANSQVPAVLISGQASIEMSAHPRTSNTHYLRKPFGGTDLLMLIQQTLLPHPVQSLLQNH